MINKENSINPAAYVICIQVLGGRIVVTQPNFGFIDGQTQFESVKTLQEIGDLVGAMMLKVKKEIAKRTVLGIPIPPPTPPKQVFDIPAHDWLGLSEAAKYLRVSESTMRRLVRGKVIPSRVSLQGKRYKVMRGDLDQYVMNGVPLFEEPRRMISHQNSQDSDIPTLADFLLSPESFFDQGS